MEELRMEEVMCLHGLKSLFLPPLEDVLLRMSSLP